MNKGERIQWACGHWLVAGKYGIQDDSVKDVPTRRCGPCTDRLHRAAPALLEALEKIRGIAAASLDSPTTSRTPVGALLTIKDEARAAIAQAK